MQIKGNQRKAVLKAIDEPSSGKYILAKAKVEAPRLSYAELRRILRSFEQQGLVVCWNPNQQTGRIYSLTAKGLVSATNQSQEFQYSAPARNSDWETQAKVFRSKSLKVVLETFNTPIYGHDHRTPTEVRKKLSPEYPISLSALIGTIRSLENLGLVTRRENLSRDERLAYYSITPKGRIIAESMNPET